MRAIASSVGSLPHAWQSADGQHGAIETYRCLGMYVLLKLGSFDPTITSFTLGESCESPAAQSGRATAVLRNTRGSSWLALTQFSEQLA
jgi:hypothetical protein